MSTEEQRKERSQKIINLYLNYPQLGVNQIGQMFGCGRDTVFRTLEKYNVPRRDDVLTQKTRERRKYGNI